MVTLWAAAVAPAATVDWSTYQHDPQHTGRSGAAFDPRDLKLAWSSPAGYYFPTIVGQTVYATRNNMAGQTILPSGVTAFDVQTGAPRWTYTPPSGTLMTSQSVVANGMIAFVGQTTGTGGGPRVFVLDANNGSPLYSVPVSRTGDGVPSIVPVSPTSAQFFYNETFGVDAVQLDATSGTQMWRTASVWGTSAVITVGGNSVFSGSTGQFVAFDRGTGASFRFHNGNVSGGGSSIPAFDPGRNRIYVRDAYQPYTDGIAAYDYSGNSTITQRWTYAGPGAEGRAGVAIGGDGTVYAASESTLVSLNPDTGAVVHEMPITNGAWDTAPVLSDGYVWITTMAGTKVYDADSLAYVTTVPVIGGVPTDPRFTSPGVVFGDTGGTWGGFISNGGFSGFSVFMVPEPATAVMLLAAAGWTMSARTRRTGR